MPTWLQPARPVRGPAAVAPSIPVTPLQAADVLSRAVPIRSDRAIVKRRPDQLPAPLPWGLARR
jgi:hypothetical protein